MHKPPPLMAASHPKQCGACCGFLAPEIGGQKVVLGVETQTMKNGAEARIQSAIRLFPAVRSHIIAQPPSVISNPHV